MDYNAYLNFLQFMFLIRFLLGKCQCYIIKKNCYKVMKIIYIQIKRKTKHKCDNVFIDVFPSSIACVACLLEWYYNITKNIFDKKK